MEEQSRIFPTSTSDFHTHPHIHIPTHLCPRTWKHTHTWNGGKKKRRKRRKKRRWHSIDSIIHTCRDARWGHRWCTCKEARWRHRWCHLHFHYTPAEMPGEDSGGATCTLNRRSPQNQHCHTLTFPQNCRKLSCCCPSHPAQSFVMSRPTASQSATGAYQFFHCLPFQFLCLLIPQHSSC